MRNLARLSLLLVIVLVVVSAYLRLFESGIGCPDWPECYGRIGPPPAASDAGMAENAYRRIVERSDAPLAWASPLHRLVASLLGLAVLGLNLQALRARKHRLVCLALLALTVFLAWLGLRSGGLHHPAVVMGNLVGGFAMLGLLGWLVFCLDPGAPRYTETRIEHIKPLTVAAIVVLCLQILLGGLTSANFAANACQTLPHCQGGWLPDATLLGAFNVSDPHEISETGHAVGSFERVAIHRAHRLGAVLTLVFVLAAAINAALNIEVIRKAGVFILVVLGAQFVVGIASVMTGLPIALAVAHNGLSGLLLLGLLKLLAVSRVRPVFIR
ncbi:MAG: heme A synthase [Xanthomonadales bacterium]|nr:heme A synthase [Xanthomonadales bacterium]NIX13814.1 heme A synthase [Xanthomonadales bacterium]